MFTPCGRGVTRTFVDNFLTGIVDTGGKITIFFFCVIFLDTDPHLASVCVISISFPFRDTSRVCVWELVYVCAYVHKFGVATNHGKFKV